MCFANEVGNGGCAIDGGFDYCKVSAGTNSDYEFVANYDLGEITREMLYEDWATGTDSYGRVENESR
jgi:hypothetical protein